MCSDTLSCGRSSGPGTPPAERSPGAVLLSSAKCCFSLSPCARLAQKQPSHRQSSLRAPAIARSRWRVHSLRRGGTLRSSRGWGLSRGLNSKLLGRERPEPRALPGQDSDQPHFLLWCVAERQVGSSPTAARFPPSQGAAGAVFTPTLRKSLSCGVCGRVFSGSVFTLSA